MGETVELDIGTYIVVDVAYDGFRAHEKDKGAVPEVWVTLRQDGDWFERPYTPVWERR